MSFVRYLLAAVVASTAVVTGIPVLTSNTAEAATVCKIDRVCRTEHRWVVKRGPRVCETVTYNGYVVDRDCVRTGSAWRVRMPIEVCHRERVCRHF